MEIVAQWYGRPLFPALYLYKFLCFDQSACANCLLISHLQPWHPGLSCLIYASLQFRPHGYHFNIFFIYEYLRSCITNYGLVF